LSSELCTVRFHTGVSSEACAMLKHQTTVGRQKWSAVVSSATVSREDGHGKAKTIAAETKTMKRP